MRLRSSLAVSTCVAIAGTLAVAPSASAATSSDLAAAILTNGALVTGSQLLNGPASAVSSLAATTPLAGFPRAGNSFAILSSGDASLAYGAQGDFRDVNHGLLGRAGGSDFDATVLRIDVNVPANANCLLGVEFRFLSEEYPEYVGDVYNDAFIAEVDETTWTSVGTTITAPGNFAKDPNGNVISINAAGEAVLNASNAAGTSYDGGTDILSAATPLTPGPHSLFFTIFDQADGGYDSTVLIDNLRIGRVSDLDDCQPGAEEAPDEPLVPVAPAPVTFADPYGTSSDTYTVPTTTGVTYQVGGVTVAAGTYPGSGTVVVTTVAQEGYELTGTTEFTHTFTDINPVAAEAPTQVDTWGTDDDTYTIPSVTGVRYEVGGATVAAGTYPGLGTVVVNAFAESGYVLTGASSFSLPFTDIRQVSAEAPTQADTWGTADDTYTIPSVTGVRYEVGGETVAAGTYPGLGTVVVNAFAEAGYVLTGESSFSLPFTNILQVSAVAPSQVDTWGTVDDTYTIPVVEGVRYEVGGVTVVAGTYPGTGTVVVNAFAEPGFELEGEDEFTLVFTDIRQVSAEAPGQVDTWGTADDTYTIASTTGVRYEVDGATVPAGTYPGAGTVVVTAVAETGYVLTGATEFTLVFTNILQVTAEAPGQVDTWGTADDTYTIPAVEGVRYEVGGATVPAGTYPGAGTVVVTAVAESGYLLTGATEFTLVFTDIRQVTAEAPAQFDTYDTADDTYTIPVVEGVRYEIDGLTVPPGTYPGSGTVVVSAVAETGYVLTGASEFTLVFTDIHQVTADAPGQFDTYDTADDTYTIASTTGVRYEVGGVSLEAGTYSGLGTVVVTAFAEVGYELTGQDVFTLVFTDIHQVAAEAPGQFDTYDTADDTYTIASTTGVRYEVGGVSLEAGTYSGLGTVVVAAFAEVGYELMGVDEFTLVFTDIHQVTAEAPGMFDTFDTADDTFTIPVATGVRYEVDGVPTVPGTYPGAGTVVVTAFAEVGYELQGQDVFTLVFTDIHQVTAEAPGQFDTYDTADDTFTIPVVEGVRYEADGVPVAAGTYPALGTVVVTAFAEVGYELTGQAEFTLVFSDIHQVTAEAPSQFDTYDTADDTYTIPTDTGVRYEVDGVPTAAGTYPGLGTVVVTAFAQPGYELLGEDEFTLVFSDIHLVTAEAPGQLDTYDTADDTFTIPVVTGVRYEVDGVPTLPGTYPGAGTVVVTAFAEVGYELTGVDEFTLVFTDIHLVTAEAPGQLDTWGTADDTFTIPVVEGVRYEVDGVQLDPGTYPGAATVVVTAFAEAGYELEGVDEFTLVFTDIRLVTADAPDRVDTWGTANDSYTIPSVVGVRYEVGGVPRGPGTYPAVGTVVVTAFAEPGYVLQGQDEFLLGFTDIRQARPLAPPSTDGNGTANDTYTIPDILGVTYWIDGRMVAPGTYPGSGTVVVHARAATGYVLSGPSVFSLQFDATWVPRETRERGDGDRSARAARLARTGSEALRIGWVGTMMLLAGVGAVALAGRGRQQR